MIYDKNAIVHLEKAIELVVIEKREKRIVGGSTLYCSVYDELIAHVENRLLTIFAVEQLKCQMALPFTDGNDML